MTYLCKGRFGEQDASIPDLSGLHWLWAATATVLLTTILLVGTVVVTSRQR